MADCSMQEFDVVGPVQIQFKNKKTHCNAIVLPGSSKPLLGAVPMELLNVIINPLYQKLEFSTELPMLPSIRPIGIVK